jgi:hypothetical protein
MKGAQSRGGPRTKHHEIRLPLLQEAASDQVVRRVGAHRIDVRDFARERCEAFAIAR